MKKPLTLPAARVLSDAKVINHVAVIATGDGLKVEINRAFFVANRDQRIRYFAKADTCFGWLREIGITRIDEVDLTHWGD